MLKLRTIIYCHVNIILDFPITYINMVVFFVKSDEVPTQKGEHSCKCTELSL